MLDVVTEETVTTLPGPETAAVGVPLLDRLALSDAEAAALLGKSRSWFRRLQAQGETPAPVRVGGATLWRTADLMAWAEAGFPSRENFDLIRHRRPARARQRA